MKKIQFFKPKPVGLIDEILMERHKQDAKWGIQNHRPLRWLAILGEEVRECNNAVLEEDIIGYRIELIHVAAVALAMLKALERHNDNS